ncbi:uncharacterized protein LOC105184826 [Harpegnathos saltator]|uniref:uncharacterized protein LOC105184826 n=1 Tax=Harpegnathos saltator TaxID=610380 RepID=UPI00059041AC|nr:uncharacterized protein LOC105184826 [Harpegnathos saltator]
MAIIARVVRFPLTSDTRTNQEFKMRSLLITVLCLSMAVCILANDYILGERKTGDYSVRDNLIIKPPLDWMAFKATIGITCPTNEIITYVKITNRSDKKVNFQRLSGDIGIRTLVVMAKANKGEGLSLRVEGYCINPNTIP